MKLATIATAGAVGGAVTEHFFDPDRGHARRARLHDQLRGAARVTSRRRRRAISKSAHHVIDHWHGRSVALISALTGPYEPIDDVTLTQKVRSETLGHRASSVLVDSANGVVTLRGVLQPDESRERILHAVERVRGVRWVEDLRHYDGESAPNKMAVLRLHQQAS
jgi:hypothetical protein